MSPGAENFMEVARVGLRMGLTYRSLIQCMEEAIRQLEWEEEHGEDVPCRRPLPRTG